MMPTSVEAREEIQRRLVSIRARIQNARARAGRRDEVELIGISKFQTEWLLRLAADAGLGDFGESRADELAEKAAQLSDTPLRWHAIGPLSAAEAERVGPALESFHALDSIETARALGRGRQVPLRSFIEVRLTDGASGTGVAPERVAPLLAAARAVPGIDVVGLMWVAPEVSPRPTDSRRHFRTLRELARSLGLAQLSMGTTGDFELAIEEGATAVRVGRAIFGVRHALLEGTPYEHLREQLITKEDHGG